jgi:hypothetical protein
MVAFRCKGNSIELRNRRAPAGATILHTTPGLVPARLAGMERPRSLIPLAIHAARVRWAQLGTVGRVAVVTAAVLVGALGVRAATGAACCAAGGCPSAHAADAP